jgi:hypothetical protein
VPSAPLAPDSIFATSQHGERVLDHLEVDVKHGVASYLTKFLVRPDLSWVGGKGGVQVRKYG